MRSIRDNVAIGAASAIFNSTPIAFTSPSVDTKGFNTAMLVVSASTTGAVSTPGVGSSTVAVLQESADNVTFATALDNTGVAIGMTIQATTTAVVNSARIEGLGLQRKRYLRFTLASNYPAALSSPSALQYTTTAVIALGRAYADPTPVAPGGSPNVPVSNT